MRRSIKVKRKVNPSFNPRICKRCDGGNLYIDPCVPVSIHASVKDATLSLLNLFFLHACFNPRICKRCDIPFLFGIYLPTGFNPRICKRCDMDDLLLLTGICVSIHASVKDATSVLTNKRQLFVFQSTHL